MTNGHLLCFFERGRCREHSHCGFQSPREMPVCSFSCSEHTYELGRCRNGQFVVFRKVCDTPRASRVLVVTLGKNPVREVGFPVHVVSVVGSFK